MCKQVVAYDLYSVNLNNVYAMVTGYIGKRHSDKHRLEIGTDYKYLYQSIR